MVPPLASFGAIVVSVVNWSYYVSVGVIILGRNIAERLQGGVLRRGGVRRGK